MGEPNLSGSPAEIFARPTAETLWLGPSQQAALSHFSRPSKIKLLLGQASTGKTTILSYLPAHLPDAVILRLLGPKTNGIDVLTTLLLDSQLGPWDLSDTEQRNLLSVFVQQRRSQHKRVIIAIDDADSIAGGAWEELDRLRRIRFNDQPALEFALCARESFVSHCPLDKYDGYGTPMKVHSLAPASCSDVTSYLNWRYLQFSMENPFTATSIRLIARAAGGKYGAINILCQMALLLMKQHNQPRVDARLVREAVVSLSERRRQAPKAPAAETIDPAPPALPVGHLLISRNSVVVSKIELKERLLIGRSEHNDLCLPGPYLSRHHAVIVGTNDGYYVVDLNSINGLQLNGKLTSRAVLQDRDILSLGPYRLKVQLSYISRNDVLPESESLADTAVMPAQLSKDPAVRIVK